MHKLTKRLLVEIYGLDISSQHELQEAYHKAIAAATLSGDVLAICTSCKTAYEDGYEPDQSEGFCEECEASTVKSILILENLI